MQDTVVFDGDCTVEITTGGDMSLNLAMDGEAGTFTKVRIGDYYTGPTEFTPTDQVQTYETQGLLMPENIVVNKIPNNYGLITWDGSTLTVS